jgi:glycosyltransferase involved in cell wall biosynthesis
VAIPCFNPADGHLRECLESVRDQTFDRWEAIVVDDGSTNGDVAGVVAGLGDARIRTVKHPANRGLGAARNSGYRAALGEVVALLDSDDRLEPRFLEETYRALQETPEAEWAFTDWQCFGASLDLWAFPNPLPPPCPEHLVHVGPGALVRPRVWRAVGGYTEDRRMSGAADWDFWITASELGLKGVHLTRALYLHRRWPGTMSLTMSFANDATNRELLYRRHKVTFDSFDGACPRCPPRDRVPHFRATGYVNSSTAALAQGDRLRSLTLAGRAIMIQPSRAAFRQLARALLPHALLRAAGIARGAKGRSPVT